MGGGAGLIEAARLSGPHRCFLASCDAENAAKCVALKKIKDIGAKFK
jgi:hypothetical protein